jgi:hypothetical protein
MTSKIPDVWKESIICPIPKKSNSSNPLDYRPVSLLCTLSKAFEKIVYDILVTYVENLKILPENQHGFRKGKSVTSQLLETYNEFSNAIENKKFIDVIYFDFSKAFDTVPHEKLLEKLQSIGVNGSLLKWFENYLFHRNFRVKVQNEFSNSKYITSGVPQGSVLGPLLFLIYISDLPEFCKTEKVGIKLYADDLKAYSISNDPNDFSQNLRLFILILEKYAILKGLKISPEKCYLLHIGSNNPKNNYKLHKIEIPTIKNEDSVRDLGIHFSFDLKWEKHLKIISGKANRVAFSLLKNLKTNNPKLLIELYMIYVLPLTEFSSQVFNPYLKKDIELLEKVQKMFLRIVYNRSHPHQETPNYSNLLKIFKLDSLEIRRLKLDLIFFHKILHGKIRINYQNSFTIKETKTRGEEYKIHIPAVSNKIRHNSFFIRVPRQYSLLPSNIRKSTPDQFKALLELVDLHSYLSRPTPGS